MKFNTKTIHGGQENTDPAYGSVMPPIYQSQSLNLFMENANYSKLTSMHFYAWKSGLKTGMYYLRTKSAVDAIKFTLSKDSGEQPVEQAAAQPVQQPVSAAPERVAQIVQEQPKMNEHPEGAPLSAEELRALIAQSKEAEGDDCLMCGS